MLICRMILRCAGTLKLGLSLDKSSRADTHRQLLRNDVKPVQTLNNILNTHTSNGKHFFRLIVCFMIQSCIESNILDGKKSNGICVLI